MQKGSAMSLTLYYNLEMGRQAVRHVRGLGIRANNGPDANAMPDGEWITRTRCIGAIPDHIRDRYGIDEDPASVRMKFKEFCGRLGATPCLQQGGVAELAKLAAGRRCGNCTEQDAVAIQFLLQYNVRPLDLMDLALFSSIDHTFIVIGRLPGGVVTDPDWLPNPQSRLWGTRDRDPSTWGPDAVVCDPWHDLGKVYPATGIQTQMFRGYNNVAGTLRPVSLWRID
jgi:hypothetical protein